MVFSFTLVWYIGIYRQVAPHVIKGCISTALIFSDLLVFHFQIDVNTKAHEVRHIGLKELQLYTECPSFIVEG